MTIDNFCTRPRGREPPKTQGNDLHGTLVKIDSQSIHTDSDSGGIGRGTVGAINGMLHDVFGIKGGIRRLLVALEEVVGIPRIVASL